VERGGKQAIFFSLFNTRKAIPKRKVAPSNIRSTILNKKVVPSNVRRGIPDKKVTPSNVRRAIPDKKVATSSLIINDLLKLNKNTMGTITRQLPKSNVARKRAINTFKAA